MQRIPVDRDLRASAALPAGLGRADLLPARLRQEERREERGFTLIELLVSMAITVEVLLIALLLFDVNSRVSKTQTEVAEMQQSQRVANYDLIRTLRMAGRGGLAQVAAIAVNSGVNSVTYGPYDVVDGTDVLTVRGVFTSPVYVTQSFTYNPGAQTGQIVIDSFIRRGVSQGFEALQDSLTDNRPEAIVLVSRQDVRVYGIATVTAGNIVPFDVDGDGQIKSFEKRLTLSFSAAPGAVHGVEYQALSSPGAFPPNLGDTAWVGVLEEYRYYVRASAGAIDGEGSKLSRARFYPNTNTIYAGNNANAAVDIADNVLDLQVALGLDLDGDGQALENENDPGADEWLFNSDGDADTDNYFGRGDADGAWSVARLYALRVSTLVSSDRPDRNYTNESIARIEDALYNEPATPSAAAKYARSFRRRLMQSVVDLRNIS